MTSRCRQSINQISPRNDTFVFLPSTTLFHQLLDQIHRKSLDQATRTMSTIMNTYRSITACPNCYRAPRQVYLQTRKATTSAVETSSQSPSSPPFSLEPHTVDSARLERKLLREKSLTPIGSRRKRALLRQGEGVPFHQQPYQCFQEARQYLVADRARKIDAINVQRERLAKMRSKALASTEDQTLQRSIKSMESNLENLKILADINDPMVKKRFEDGKGQSSTHHTTFRD